MPMSDESVAFSTAHSDVPPAPGDEAPPDERELNPRVRALFDHLGVQADAGSDPALLREVLEDDLSLDDVVEVERILGSALDVPFPLSSVLSDMARGLVVNHEPLVDFLCGAMADGLLPRLAPSVGAAALRWLITHGGTVVLSNRVTPAPGCTGVAPKTR